MHKNASFENNPLKVDTRLMLLDYIRKQFPKRSARIQKNGLRVITNPGSSLDFEDMLTDFYPNSLKLTGVENKRSVYTQAREKAEEMQLPISLFYGDVLKYLSLVREQHDVIWLDLMGPWSNKQARLARELAKGNKFSFKNGNPIVAWTFHAGHEPRGKLGEVRSAAEVEFLDRTSHQSKMGEDDDMLARRLGIPVLINQELERSGAPFWFLARRIHYYHDLSQREHGAPMILFVFEVQKGIFDANKYHHFYEPKIIPTHSDAFRTPKFKKKLLN